MALLTIPACGGDGDGGPPPDGPATLAYAVSECQESAKGEAAFLRQTLYVRRNNGEDHPVVAFGPVGPVTGYGVCRAFGRTRLGFASIQGFPVQRLGVSRDGALVVFEITDDFSLMSRSQVAPEQEGMYVSRDDGSGLRQLTMTRGMTTDTDGTVHVELPGPWAIPNRGL